MLDIIYLTKQRLGILPPNQEQTMFLSLRNVRGSNIQVFLTAFLVRVSALVYRRMESSGDHIIMSTVLRYTWVLLDEIRIMWNIVKNVMETLSQKIWTKFTQWSNNLKLNQKSIAKYLPKKYLNVRYTRTRSVSKLIHIAKYNNTSVSWHDACGIEMTKHASVFNINSVIAWGLVWLMDLRRSLSISNSQTETKLPIVWFDEI